MKRRIEAKVNNGGRGGDDVTFDDFREPKKKHRLK